MGKEKNEGGGWEKVADTTTITDDIGNAVLPPHTRRYAVENKETGEKAEVKTYGDQTIGEAIAKGQIKRK